MLSPQNCRDKNVAAPILVLGYGNELRGDDAVGPRAAATVEEWKLTDVRAVSVHQLTPELADPISQARAVIFVDAAVSSNIKETTVISLEPASESELAGHTSDPRTLLTLALALFNFSPLAWLVQIPVEHFDLGQPLSPTAERGLAAALKHIRQLIQGCD